MYEFSLFLGPIDLLTTSLCQCLVGIWDFENVIDFYKSFQIKKTARKKIKKIELDFNYNFDNNEISFDNVKIDDEPNINVQKYIDNFLSDKSNKFNKIIFKNFVNNFFISYVG